MRKLLVLAVAAVLATAAFAIPALAATKTVPVGDIWFISKAKNHSTITVAKGTKVTWKFVGKAAHQVTVQSGPKKFSSKPITKGTYSQTLTKPGTYKVFCKLHSAALQSMVIKVK